MGTWPCRTLPEPDGTLVGPGGNGGGESKGAEEWARAGPDDVASESDSERAGGGAGAGCGMGGGAQAQGEGIRGIAGRAPGGTGSAAEAGG